MRKVGGHGLDKSHAPNSWHGTAQPLSLLNVRELAPTLWGARHLLPLPAFPSAVASLTHRLWCNSTLHKLSHQCQESGILKAFHIKAQSGAATDLQGGTQLPLPWTETTQYWDRTLIKTQQRVKARCFLASRWSEMDLGIFFTTEKGGRTTKGYWKKMASSSVYTCHQRSNGNKTRLSYWKSSSSSHRVSHVQWSTSTEDSMCCSSSTFEGQLSSKATS